jgi:hypothetical protein
MAPQEQAREELRSAITDLCSLIDWLRGLQSTVSSYRDMFDLKIQYHESRKYSGFSDIDFHRRFQTYDYHSSDVIACHSEIRDIENQCADALKNRGNEYYTILQAKPLRNYCENTRRAAGKVIDFMARAMRTETFKVDQANRLLRDLAIELSNWRGQAKDTLEANENAFRRLR